MPGLTEIRQQIETLAIALLVGDTPPSGANPSACSALTAIAEAAGTSGLQDLERLAAALADSAAGGLSATELQEGVTRLQDAFETVAAPVSNSLANDPELLRDFVLESREHLSSIEAQALALERNPLDNEVLNAAFRSFHTIKGLAGFLELWEVQKLAHEVETLLDGARNGELRISEGAIDVVLESADYLRRWLSHLDAVLSGGTSTQPARDEALLTRIHAVSAAPVPGELARTPRPPDAPTPVEPVAETSARRTPSEAMTVKVDTAKLDYLVDMAGEMVIAQSLVHHDPDLGAVKTPKLQRNLAQLGRITAELQKTAMALRLVPIGPLFRRMARLVRDLSRQFGKTVEMETEGDDIELDRTIVEELADPLMHMVRNALDHGIEPPEERESHGKPPGARLLLRAHHQAGHVVIEIADDGRGLDRNRIIARAVERGVLASGAELTDSDVFNLIFEPGFSTAAQVTKVSGRGVGMDVVRKHIQKLRGRIEIRSTLGQGASFVLKLPLTLAIIDGLVVGVGSERYIVPLFAVHEMFRPSADVVWTVQQRGEMALVRDVLLPVVRLYRRFGTQPRSENPLECVLVVAETEGRRFCVMVDELIGKQEVVIKSLGETFKNVTGVAGGAILGDGRVGLILDLDGIFAQGRVDAVH